LAKYNSIDTIPAKTFFSILESKDYQQLKPKPKEKGLEELFISIYDEFFLKSDNPESNEYLRCTKNIAFITYKINILKQSLHFYFYNLTTQEMREEFIKSLKDGYEIEIDRNIPFIDEVKRILTIEIGILENDLAFEESNFKSLTSNSKNKAFDYEENIVNIEGVLNNNIKDGVKLDKYIAYEKKAKRIVEQSKTKK